MGLTVYKPPNKNGKNRDRSVIYFIAEWLFWLMVIIAGWDIGSWLHTGVWQW